MNSRISRFDYGHPKTTSHSFIGNRLKGRAILLGFLLLCLVASPAVFTYKGENSVNAQIFAPVIDSICPSAPRATVGNQFVSVTGVNFQSGLTVTVSFPNGGSATLSGTQILFFSSISFVMQIDFNGNPGVYSIRVNNPNGAQSNTLSFQVNTFEPRPQINSISPSNPVATFSNQSISINGKNFRQGLTVSLLRQGVPVSTQIDSGIACEGFVIRVNFNGLAGTHTVTVTNPDGQVSNQFSFTASSPPCTAPSITSQPTDQTINSGQQAGLVVSANGTPPLFYQWYQGTSGNTSNPINGATSASFTTPILTSTTTYWVRVSNSCGGADSRTVTVNVNAACTSPSITAQPVDQTITSGQQAGLVVSANGTSPLLYQWYQGVSGNTNNPINGATSASFTTPILTSTTTYWVQVRNNCGSVNSRTVTVNVTSCVLPSITTQPGDQTINSGQTATLTVAASGTPPLRYQWYRGLRGDISNPVSGATSSSFTTPSLTTTTSYWVYVENACGHDDSRTVTITVTQVTQFCLTTSVSPSGSGSVTRSQAGPCYNSGTSVTLTATPAAGFAFDRWSGSVIGNSNPLTVTMNANKNIVANFVALQTPLFGVLGIGDGQLFWPLDGPAVVGMTVRATRLGNTITARINKPNYTFDNISPGIYTLEVSLTYREQVTINNETSCRGILGGCVPSLLQKTVNLTIRNVRVPRATAFDIQFPMPLVMVHGTRSCFRKWYGFQSDPQANDYWDNVARSQGFISLTPNYHSEAVEQRHWEDALAEIRLQIEDNFQALSLSTAGGSYPGWIFIGHSQGGLFARVLTSGPTRNSALARSLRKIYLLGTPNSGALSDVGANLLCSPLLGPLSMQASFNNTYPHFGSKPVTVFAGTKHCDLVTGICQRRAYTDDSVVPVEFVHVVYVRGCEAIGCPPIAALRLSGPDLFYTHEELGSSATRSTILERRILSDVTTLSPLSSSSTLSFPSFYQVSRLTTLRSGEGAIMPPLK